MAKSDIGELILFFFASVTTNLRDCFTGLGEQEELAVVKVATEFEDLAKYISGCSQAKKYCLLYL